MHWIHVRLISPMRNVPAPSDPCQPRLLGIHDFQTFIFRILSAVVLIPLSGFPSFTARWYYKIDRWCLRKLGNLGNQHECHSETSRLPDMWIRLLKLFLIQVATFRVVWLRKYKVFQLVPMQWLRCAHLKHT